MSSESSSEDEFERFREAVDGNFLTEDLYKTSATEKKEKNPQPEPLPSLRNANQEAVSFNPFSIKVTPEFQHHVSLHLSRLLDESIDDSKQFLKVKKHKRDKKTGVKLLCKSKDYLLSLNGVEGHKNSRKQMRRHDSDCEDYEKKAKEVAVTAEWVLSKKELEHWASNTKGEVEIIKINNQKRKNKITMSN